MNKQKEFILINDKLSRFISQLSDNEFESLLNGSSYLKLEQNRQKMTEKKIDEVLTNIIENQIERIEDLDGLNLTKDELMDILDYIQISYKKRDSKNMLISSILSYLKKNSDTYKNKIQQNNADSERLNLVYKNLINSLDMNEANKILIDSNNIRSRKELETLANMLHVNIGKELSYERACKKILDDVVASKIRSYKIRNKL